jgi:hypothetical protein
MKCCSKQEPTGTSIFFANAKYGRREEREYGVEQAKRTPAVCNAEYLVVEPNSGQLHCWYVVQLAQLLLSLRLSETSLPCRTMALLAASGGVLGVELACTVPTVAYKIAGNLACTVERRFS